MTSEVNISQLFQSLGIMVNPFNPVPGLNGVNGTIAMYMGLQVETQIHQGQIFLAQILIGYVPQANIAPLLRQMLNLNALMVGVYFCIQINNAILLRTSRNVQGLDQTELKMLLDNLCSSAFQHGMNIQTTFQLPSMPS